jgi:glucose-1-phosphate cytidylyltransferase
MKAVILAGGIGSRLSEETITKPKPMVEIGGKPILWHIMNIYAAHGVKEFVVALGYKGDVIKNYFLNFFAFNSDLTVSLSTGQTVIQNGRHPDWKVHLVDTGLNTQTGGRLKRLERWVRDDETFMFTYGDGVADIDVQALLEFHRTHGALATVTTVRSPERFGRIVLNEDRIREFYEKPETSEGWINGGYFVLNRKVLDYIDGDDSIWERGPIEKLAHEGELTGYRHHGFWSCMDTLKEQKILEELWQSGGAPWKIWDEEHGHVESAREPEGVPTQARAAGGGRDGDPLVDQRATERRDRRATDRRVAERRVTPDRRVTVVGREDSRFFEVRQESPA